MMVFNAEEVLQMAEQIERNGARFYRRAAEFVKDPAVNKLLLELAAWEDGHEKLFASMRARLGEREREKTVFDPEGEGGMYLKAMADGQVFDVRQLDPGEHQRCFGSPCRRCDSPFSPSLCGRLWRRRLRAQKRLRDCSDTKDDKAN